MHICVSLPKVSRKEKQHVVAVDRTEAFQAVEEKGV